MKLLRETIRKLIRENEQNFMFHGTSSLYLDDILSHGLQAGHQPGATAAATKQGWELMQSDLDTTSVFLTSDEKLARTYANWTSENGSNGTPVILAIDAAGLQLVPDPLEAGGYTTNFVPADRISIWR